MSDMPPSVTPTDVVDRTIRHTESLTNISLCTASQKQLPDVAHCILGQLRLSIALATSHAWMKNSMAMVKILARSHPLKILGQIILFVAITMIGLVTWRAWSHKCLANQRMNGSALLFGWTLQIHPKIPDFCEFVGKNPANKGAPVRLDAPHSPKVRHFVPTLKPYDRAPFFGYDVVSHLRSFKRNLVRAVQRAIAVDGPIYCIKHSQRVVTSVVPMRSSANVSPHSATERTA